MKRTRAPWCRIGSALLVAALAPGAEARIGGDDGIPDLERQAPASTIQRVHLEVVVNRTRLPRLAEFEQRGDRLYAPVAGLRAIGLRLPGYADDQMLALDALPGITVRYDAAQQRLEIDAPLSELDLDTTLLGAPEATSPVVAEAAPGMLLNYDLYATEGDTGSSLTATSELRVFGIGRGVLSNTAVARRYRVDGQPWHGEAVRLDTSWQLSFPEQALTLTLGDTYTGFLDWTRPVRIGGIQLGRNYALQPYRITTPLPEFLGEAVVPSDVELYVNGLRQYSGNTPAGPFQLTTIPGLTGAGNAQLVVTDAFGQVRTLDFPFYSTQRLLARGLSDWSASLGTVREDYGIRSFSYASDLVATGTVRYGVSDSFTVEGHAETAGDLVNAGVGGVWLLGMAGVLNLSHARSSLDGSHGSQTSLGYGWNNRHFNFSVDSRRTHGDYRDIASLYGPAPPTRSERALAGITTQALGNLSLSYVRLDYAEPDLAPARYAGLYWSRSFANHWSANVSYNHNLDDAEDRSLYLSVLVPLGPQRQLGLSWQRDRDRDNAVVDLVRPVPGDGGYGWRLQARAGDDGGGGGGLAEAGWLGQHLRLGAGIMQADDFRHAYAQTNGSLVWMGGSVFAARSIQDAFAVVSTDGRPGIPVKLENRVVGQTNSQGMLLVTPLSAWQRNKLSIDPMDLPADVRVTEVDRIATPADRAGTRVRFSLAQVRAAVVVLRDGQGQPLPLGSRVHVEGSSSGAIVGHDGETYLEQLQARNRIRVEMHRRTCEAAFPYPETPAATIPRIGPLACLEPAP